MSAFLTLTAIGADRPGLVDDLSACLSDLGLNIEASRMAVLGGEFALIMLVSGDEDKVEGLIKDPSGVCEKTGFQAFVKKTRAPGERDAPASLPYSVSASGMDHPGLVHEISAVIRSFEANIEEMDTSVSPAPVSGAPIFSLRATVSVPSSVRVRDVRAALAELGDDLNMDIEFEHKE